MKVSFFGASQTVTGSCYKIQLDNGINFLIDCGMFQGKDVEFLNNKEFQFEPSSISFVLLTHAHMDHCGLLPKLVAKGFKGKIFLTPPTASLTELILLDSAKIQELNSLKSNYGYSDSMPRRISTSLYDTRDANKTISQFTSFKFNNTFSPTEGLKVKFVPAGHILGAVSVHLEYKNKLVIFSGDIGRINQSIINPFDSNIKFDKNPDLVVMESLYGGMEHPSRQETEDRFIKVINDTIQSGGNVIIPSFAIHRTQELLLLLKKSFYQNRIKSNVQIYLDSPMAVSATKIYTSNSGYFNSEEFKKFINMDNNHKESDLTFNFKNLNYVRNNRKSKNLVNTKNAVIIAGSGMVEGGRVLNHIAFGAKNKKNTILFVGFQAEQTLGRKIVEGSKEIVVNNKLIKLNSQIEYLRGFSAHADEPTLLKWLNTFKNPQKIALVHAEINNSTELKNTLQKTHQNTDVIIPKLYDEIEI